ncbi:M48 family metalloprotease [Aquabacterium sp.]|uniref:M48 family metalloprotease n=1 Tax=Aquabacterium sp. TaxID=1872578 RepID=UPI002E33E2A6|nr:M48 family metalloprotease [Aquabacterium sp.]HEX5311878.1 M48 family metalloprotease [Aquabacterium sp.]
MHLSRFLRQGLTPIQWAVACALICAGPSLQAQAPQVSPDSREGYAQAGDTLPPVLPELGDTASQDLSPAAERRLGDRIMRSIWPDPSVIDDPLVLEYIEQVWQTLLASARQRGEITQDLDSVYAWRPFLVQDRTINAFALPGGYIGVHLGLLAMTSSPDELASVLAHELSHVTQRHIARTIGVQSRQSWVSLASIILGVMAASRSPQAAQAVIMGGQAASMQGQLNFSRDMEREADRVGFGVLTSGGFEPSGMAQMFEHLQTASRLNDDGSYPYLRTHPLTTERIGDARARLGPQAWNGKAVMGDASRPVVARHMLMAARARVLMDPRSSFIATLTSPAVTPRTPALEAVTLHYMAAVASQQLRDLDHAQNSLNLARRLVPQLPGPQATEVTRLLTLAEIELHLQARQGQQAREDLNALYRNPKRIQPRPEMMLAAHLALTVPGPEQDAAMRQAASDLQTHLSDHPYDSAAWGALSQLWQHLNEPIRAVRAEAEASAARGDLPGAIDRVLGAHKRFTHPSGADTIELSAMDSRLKIWQRQQREDLREDAAGR